MAQHDPFGVDEYKELAEWLQAEVDACDRADRMDTLRAGIGSGLLIAIIGLAFLWGLAGLWEQAEGAAPAIDRAVSP